MVNPLGTTEEKFENLNPGSKEMESNQVLCVREFPKSMNMNLREL